MEHSQRKKTMIIKGYEDDELVEVMSQFLIPDIWAHQQYQAISDEIEEIYKEYPRVQSILDWKKPEALLKEEVKALLKVLALESDIYDIEQKVLVVRAQSEVIDLFCRRTGNELGTLYCKEEEN